MRKVGALVPYANNARTHSADQIEMIARSIDQWGWTNPILVDETDNIIAGHGRVLAAKKRGIEDVPVMVARGWTEAQRRAYVIADNKIALEAGWDDAMLRAEFGTLSETDFDLSLTGFSDAELRPFLGGGGELEDDAGKVPDVPANPTSRLGDLWLLGDHRVLCGDATVPANMERLLAGEHPFLMVTDPPYGVSYEPAWRNEAGISNTQRTGKVANDDRVDWTEVWKLVPCEVAYVWHAGRHAGEVAANLFAAGLEVRSQIIWAKGRLALSRGNYHWQHEPCWYAVRPGFEPKWVGETRQVVLPKGGGFHADHDAAWYVVRKGSKAFWVGDRKQTTLWTIEPVVEDKTRHGTQKPLECMGRPMRNHDSPIVLDPFLGSGSTLIAAHLQGRRCLGLELDPAYVDVIIGRWQNHSGASATLDGVPFDKVAQQRAGLKPKQTKPNPSKPKRSRPKQVKD